MGILHNEEADVRGRAPWWRCQFDGKAVRTDVVVLHMAVLHTGMKFDDSGGILAC